jgi:hypothetical protein
MRSIVACAPSVSLSAVIASDSEAIQSRPLPQSSRLDCLALLAMTGAERFGPEKVRSLERRS